MSHPPVPPPAAAHPGPFGSAPTRTGSPVPVVGAGAPVRVPATTLDAQALASAQRFMDFVADDESSEVLANGPGHVSRKARGQRLRTDIDFGSVEAYHRFINEVLLPWTDTADRIDGRTVVIEGQLTLGSPGRSPMLARVHVVAPPGVPHAQVTIAKKPRIELTLGDLAANGTMTPAQAAFLAASARARRTIVIAGPTGSGKTTFLQALTHAFDPHDRVVVVEETPELRLPLDDVVYLRATLERPGLEAKDIFDMGFWTKQANRMRMDRIIIGETRGAEMADWLIAANSGAEGSATTVHANTPRRTLDKVLALAMKADTAPSEAHLRREIAVTVDLIVQIGLVAGRHVITEIEEISDTVSTQTGQIQTSTIFAFDAATGQHVCRNRPTDAYLAACAARGVPMDLRWFQQS